MEDKLCTDGGGEGLLVTAFFTLWAATACVCHAMFGAHLGRRLLPFS